MIVSCILTLSSPDPLNFVVCVTVYFGASVETGGGTAPCGAVAFCICKNPSSPEPFTNAGGGTFFNVGGGTGTGKPAETDGATGAGI